MPGGDGTGPMGMGLMTGRGAGYCSGYGMPGNQDNVPGGGRRVLGRGGGRGNRNMYYATGLPRWARGGFAAMPEANEKDVLKKQAEYLSGELEDVKKRINTLEKAEKQEK